MAGMRMQKFSSTLKCHLMPLSETGGIFALIFLHSSKIEVVELLFVVRTVELKGALVLCWIF
jgi:hypothetical protein